MLSLCIPFPPLLFIGTCARKRSESAPIEAQHASSAVPPLFPRLCDITPCHRATFA